jgi:hypothetical protein
MIITNDVFIKNKSNLATELDISRATLDKRLRTIGRGGLKIDDSNYDDIKTMLQTGKVPSLDIEIKKKATKKLSLTEGDRNEHKQYNDLVELYEYNLAMIQLFKDRLPACKNPMDAVMITDQIKKHEIQLHKNLDLMNKIELPETPKKSDKDLLLELS